ncbi:MAG: hypothetical protein ACYC9S_02320 [Leptospirales bacterium]
MEKTGSSFDPLDLTPGFAQTKRAALQSGPIEQTTYCGVSSMKTPFQFRTNDFNFQSVFGTEKPFFFIFQSFRFSVAMLLLVFSLAACGKGGGGGGMSSSGGGGSSGVAGVIFVANPNSGNLNSYSYNSGGTISSEISSVTLSSLAGNTSTHSDLTPDIADGIVFFGTKNNGNTSNEEWSNLYTSSNGTISTTNAQSNTLATSGTAQNTVIDPINHFVLSLGSTGGNAYPYNPSTGVLGTPFASNPQSTVFTADFQNKFAFGWASGTLSDYAYSSSNGTISTTVNSSIPVAAPSGATQASGAIDASHGFIFVFFRGTNQSYIVPVPYNKSNGSFGTPAATVSINSSGIDTVCSQGSSASRGLDTVNNLLFAEDQTNGSFYIYSYNSSTGAITSTPQYSPGNLNTGYCAAVDQTNRILFFLSTNSNTAYSVQSYNYPANGTTITSVNSVGGASTVSSNASLSVSVN